MARAPVSPRQEEREARAEQKRIERLQAKRAAYQERAARVTRAEVIREELARPRAAQCRCGITTRSTPAQLMAMGAGCTAGQYVCPVLDTVRRRLKL